MSARDVQMLELTVASLAITGCIYIAIKFLFLVLPDLWIALGAP